MTLISKINVNGLYKCVCPEKYHSERDYLYHCKNWTFIPKVCGNEIIMLDTFYKSFDSHKIKVTPDNISDFEFVFDFNDVKQIPDKEADEYEEANLYFVATNSGGYSCGKLYWVNKDAQKSKHKIKEKILRKVECLNRQLEWAKDELSRLEENGLEVDA